MLASMQLMPYNTELGILTVSAKSLPVMQDMSKEEENRLEEELKGTTETITLDAKGQALVERRDVWGGSGSSKSLGLRFG